MFKDLGKQLLRVSRTVLNQSTSSIASEKVEYDPPPNQIKRHFIDQIPVRSMGHSFRAESYYKSISHRQDYPISYTIDRQNYQELVKDAIVKEFPSILNNSEESRFLIEAVLNMCRGGPVNIHADVPKAPLKGGLSALYPRGWASSKDSLEFVVAPFNNLVPLAQKSLIGKNYSDYVASSTKTTEFSQKFKDHVEILSKHMTLDKNMRKNYDAADFAFPDIDKNEKYCPAFAVVSGPDAVKVPTETRIELLKMEANAIYEAAQKSAIDPIDIRIGFTVSPYCSPKSFQQFVKDCSKIIEKKGMKPVVFVDAALRGGNGNYITDLKGNELNTLIDNCVQPNMAWLSGEIPKGALWATDDLQKVSPQTLAVHKIIARTEHIRKSTPTHINQDEVRKSDPNIELENCGLDPRKLDNAPLYAKQLDNLWSKSKPA